MKKLLTIDDLYSFYTNRSRSSHFSAEKSGECIVVQTPGKLCFDLKDDNQGLFPVTLKACHTLKNLNKSFIDESVMTDALPSFRNKPILAYIHKVDGQYEFYDHRMHEDEDGNIVYDECPVGIVPESCDAHLELDEEDDEKKYVVVNGYLYEDYSQAVEIVKREQECPVSVELSIQEMSYSAKDKVLVIEKFIFNGVTILGKDPDGDDVEPGMKGANITIADFSAKNNSMITVDVLSKAIEKLSAKVELLSRKNFNIKNMTEGGSGVLKSLLEKYSVTIEDLPFASEIEGMSDEELLAKFTELFEETEGNDTGAEAGAGTEGTDSNTETGSDTGEQTGAEEGSNEEGGAEGSEESGTGEGAEGGQSEGGSTETGDPEGGQTGGEEPLPPEEDPDGDGVRGCNDDGTKKKNVYSLSLNNKIYSFALSLNSKIEALCALVNDTYSDSDQAWYCVQVFDNYLVMIDYWKGEAYRQNYTESEDSVFALAGEREAVYCQWLTQAEIDSLDQMKREYASFIQSTEQNQREEVLNDETYSVLHNTEEWKEFVKEAGKYSVSDLSLKADALYGRYCKKSSSLGSVGLSYTQTKKSDPYGNLFKE